MTIPEEILNTYIIERAIGEGGGGIVYLATHKRLLKKVVLKRIKGIGSDFVNYRAEVDILKNLRHSYLPQVIDFIESPEGIFTVMDYIDGESFKAILDRGYRFSEKEVRKYAGQICEAVDYLHSQNPPIIHGDIKPDNIMLTRDGNICLIDFNISGFLSKKGVRTIGITPGYSSPEQVEAFNEVLSVIQERKKTSLQSDPDEPEYVPWDYEEEPESESSAIDSSIPDEIGSKVDVRSDIYSLGATVYVLLGGNIKNLQRNSLAFPDKISDGMRILVAKALEPDPKRRYQTASAMLESIRQVLKMDFRYRSLLIKQRVMSFVYVVILVAAVLLIVFGSRKMASEKEERYEGYVDKLKVADITGTDREEVEGLYRDAIEIHPDRLEPYYYKADYLYKNEALEEMVTFIEKIEDIAPAGESSMYSELWYLMADSLFDFEEYSRAKDYYSLSIDLDPDNVSLYRDYAISLIYVARLQKAEEVLDTAIKKGMKEADIFMVQGELFRLKESRDYTKAIRCFESVIEKTDDDQQKLRAGVNLAKCCIETGTKESLSHGIEVLKKVSKELKMSDRLLVLENLGATYIALSDLTKDAAAYIEAAEIYEDIVRMGWANENTYSNLVVLNQRAGRTDEAHDWAEQMCGKYPDSYVSYMRMASVELVIQSGLADEKRDYSVFEEFFKKAEDLYSSVKKEKVDGEMLFIEDSHNKLVAGGWLD